MRGRTVAGMELEKLDIRRSAALAEGAFSEERFDGNTADDSGKNDFISARKINTPPVFGP